MQIRSRRLGLAATKVAFDLVAIGPLLQEACLCANRSNSLRYRDIRGQFWMSDDESGARKAATPYAAGGIFRSFPARCASAASRNCC